MKRGKGHVKITRIKFNYPGFNEVRKSPELTDDMTARGERIAAAARAEGGEFYVITTSNATRSRVIVTTGDIEAMNGEASDRRLTRALQHGQG